MSHQKKRVTLKEKLIILEKMRIESSDAIKIEDYMQECYSPSDDLISPAYFSFALLVMKRIRRASSRSKLIERKNRFISLGWKEVESTQELKKSFYSIS